MNVIAPRKVRVFRRIMVNIDIELEFNGRSSESGAQTSPFRKAGRSLQKTELFQGVVNVRTSIIKEFQI